MATKTITRKDDVIYYCDTICSELSDMKKKAFDFVYSLETTTPEEIMSGAEFFELFDLIDHLEEKVDALTRRCYPD